MQKSLKEKKKDEYILKRTYRCQHWHEQYKIIKEKYTESKKGRKKQL
jgi:hypothetical protein